MIEDDKDKQNSITTKTTYCLTLQQHLPQQPSINQSGNTMIPNLSHTGTNQLSQQIDHQEYAEDLISSKRESRNYFAAYATIRFYWLMLYNRLNNLKYIYVSRTLLRLCTGVISWYLMLILLYLDCNMDQAL